MVSLKGLKEERPAELLALQDMTGGMTGHNKA
jgi:hypothetical protein